MRPVPRAVSARKPVPRGSVDATPTTPARMRIVAESSARPLGREAAAGVGAESGAGVAAARTGAVAAVESTLGRTLSALAVNGAVTGSIVADEPPVLARRTAATPATRTPPAMIG